MTQTARSCIWKRRVNLGGLWKFISEKFQDLQATVMDAIRDMIISKVVEAGIKWIIGLLNPASAFVKAVMMVIDIGRFFIERAADIIELVKAFVDGIRALANGDIAGVAAGVEKALAKSIPILLGFLASLLGITGLTGKVTKIIKKVRKRVDKVIGKLIAKAGRIFGKKRGKRSDKGVDGKADLKNEGKEKHDSNISPQDKAKHEKIVKQVATDLKKIDTKGKTYDELRKELMDRFPKERGKHLKKLKPNLDLTLKLNDPAKDAKDEDLDFVVVIAPNDSKKEDALKVQIFERLRKEDVVNLVKKVASKQRNPNKLPSWAAVFACAGKHVTIEKGDEQGHPLTFGDAMNQDKAPLFRKIRESLMMTYESVAAKYLSENNLAEEAVLDEIDEVARRVVDSVWNKELIFIAPTEIIRNLPDEEFVVKNKNLKALETSYTKAKHLEILKESDGILGERLRTQLQSAELNAQVHHTLSLYLGGDHRINNLLTLFGAAGTYSAPHGMMHELVDKTNISKFLVSQKEVKLDYKSLAKHFTLDKLGVLVGVLKTNGEVKYQRTKLKIKD